MALRHFSNFIFRASFFILVFLGGCAPVTFDYYAPQGEVDLSPERCGRPSTTIIVHRNGVDLSGFVSDNDIDVKLKTQMILNLQFEIPQSHKVKILSAESLAFLDGADTPVQAHAQTPSDAQGTELEAKVGEDMQGSNKSINKYGYEFPTRVVSFEVLFDSPGDLHKTIKYVLPPISFDGKEAEIFTWTFVKKTTTVWMPLNGC